MNKSSKNTSKYKKKKKYYPVAITCINCIKKKSYFHCLLQKNFRTVIDTLKNVDGNRKCFRLIGGVLCERTVKEVLPQLNDSKDQLDKLISSRQEHLTSKGVEINQFRDKHNIKIKGQDDAPIPATEQTNPSGDAEKIRNVLVAN